MGIQRIVTAMIAAAVLTIAGFSQAPALSSSKESKSASKTASAVAPPSDAEIADAKSKGLVWVNTSTKFYHKEGPFYGRTKRGKFMTEDEATKAGYRAAKEPSSSKKAKTTDKK